MTHLLNLNVEKLRAVIKDVKDTNLNDAIQYFNIGVKSKIILKDLYISLLKSTAVQFKCQFTLYVYRKATIFEIIDLFMYIDVYDEALVYRIIKYKYDVIYPKLNDITRLKYLPHLFAFFIIEKDLSIFGVLIDDSVHINVLYQLLIIAFENDKCKWKYDIKDARMLYLFSSSETIMNIIVSRMSSKFMLFALER